MSDKVPPNLLELLAPIWVYALSLLAAVAAYLEKLSEEVKNGASGTWKLKVLKLITQIFASALAAVLTHRILHALHVDENWQLPLVGIGAHMGTEALKLLGEIWKQRIGVSQEAKGKKDGENPGQD
jgi:hypothetical protein